MIDKVVADIPNAEKRLSRDLQAQRRFQERIGNSMASPKNRAALVLQRPIPNGRLACPRVAKIFSDCAARDLRKDRVEELGGTVTAKIDINGRAVFVDAMLELPKPQRRQQQSFGAGSVRPRPSSSGGSDRVLVPLLPLWPRRETFVSLSFFDRRAIRLPPDARCYS